MYSDTFETAQSKLYLERRSGASDQLTRIGRRKASNLDSEATQEEKGKDWSLSSFGSRTREETCFLQCLWSKIKVRELILSLSELASFHPNFGLLSFVDK